MKKLLLILVEIFAVFTLALLVASCGGGGGGGGGDEPAAATPVQNENSVLNMNAPTYSDANLNITSSPNASSFTAGTSVTFTADSGYESYTWYIGDNQVGTANPFTLDTTSLSGPYQLFLIVSDGENFFSSSKNISVTAAN